MKQRTEVSMQLYKLMLERGYPEEFCDIITKNLNTDFTAYSRSGYSNKGLRICKGSRRASR